MALPIFSHPFSAGYNWRVIEGSPNTTVKPLREIDPLLQREIDLRLQRRLQLPPSDIFLKWKWFVTSYLQFSTMLLGKKLMGKTHYDILGVREDANYEEIRTSYRSAILDSHPDKLQKTSETSFPNHESGNRFLEVQRAWEILSNAKLRVAYDSELQASRHDFVAAEDVGLEDLMVENTGEFLELFYQCRCGDYFSIDSSELEEMGYQLLRDGSKISLHISDATLPSSIILSCGSCSLQVRLLINADIKLQTNDHL